MNNIFSIKRLGFLFSDHISNKRNQYLLFSGIMLSLFLLSAFIHLFWRQDFGVKVLVIGGSLAIILAPFAFHLRKTESSYMLPASVLEKFLPDLMANIVFIPLLTIGIGIICTLIGCTLFDNYVPSDVTPKPDLFNAWLRLAGIQSIIILGHSIFKKYILAKTMLMGVLLFTLLIVCLKVVAYFSNEPFIFEDQSAHIALLKLFFIVSMWIVSYFSFKKVQI